MSIDNINTAVLKRILALQGQREKLSAQLSAVEKEIRALLGGASPGRPSKASAPAKAGKTKGRQGRAGRRRGRRGETGQKILDVLQAANGKPVTVKQIAEKTKIPPQNLFVWFNTTGKKTKGISKVAPATYKLS